MLTCGRGIVSAATKLLSGWWAARRAGVNPRGSLRAGAATGLGVNAGLEPQLGPLAAAYVLFLAVVGPVLARTIEPLYAAFPGRKV